MEAEIREWFSNLSLQLHQALAWLLKLGWK